MAYGATGLEQPVMDVASGDISAEELRSNFIWFTGNFAVTHGVVTTPLVIATSVLNKDVGYLGNALINVFTLASAFLLGAPAIGAIGMKKTVVLGMLLYCIYCGCFALAAIVGTSVVALQYLFFCGGSICGGIAAGMLWTAQGPYLGRTIDLLVDKEEGTDRAAVTAELWGQWGLIYLGCEVAAKVLWSVLAYIKVPGWLIAVGYTCIGAVCMVLMASRAKDFKAQGPRQRWTEKIQAAASLWTDPALFLLSGSNLTFGFSAAFMNGYVNGNYTSPQLGSFAVAMLAAFTALIAAIGSRLFGPLAANFGKGAIVTFGAFCFLMIVVCFKAIGCCENWGWGLILLYVLQGMGRAVYESTNKGVFTDFFPNDAVGAFANCMMQSSLAFAVSFFLSSVLSGPALETIILILSIFTPLGYASASFMRRRRDDSYDASSVS
mmetsp:Transcript_129792/g.277016  ORF Transcript_129792/g.277016 Transcript_129792/m.277016 type:complete len:436 (-) Transcript_129792:102-1409(-)